MLTKAPASNFAPGTTEDGDEDGSASAELALINSLGGVLLDKRKEAQDWRQQSGIEEDWAEDEEFYQAMDRANPEGDSNVGKPLSADGGAENRQALAQQITGRSSVFIPITRAYVDAASARVADMLLPSDDAPWDIKATPVQDDPQAQPVDNPASAMPALMTPTAQAAATVASPEAMAAGGMAMQPGAVVQSQVLAVLPDEEKRAERAKVVISDWLTECQWHAEMRKVVEDSSLLGTGVLKGPFPVQRRGFKYQKGPDGVSRLVETSKVVPISRRVNPRNFWVDPAGGEDHQSGSYCWELDNIGSRQLRALLKDPTYIHENIEAALREGPSSMAGKDRPDNAAWQVDVGATFPLWYFYGDIEKRAMMAAGIPQDLLPEGEPDSVSVAAMVVMVNERVIKIAQTPLDAGGFPYDMFPWQRRPGIPWGKGVSRQIRTPQRMLNAGVRALMDNGALTSGPQWGIRREWVEAIDGRNNILTARKGWFINSKAPPNAKMEDIISFTNIQSAVSELNMILDRAMRFAEDATGLPMLMQGQQGEATNTATGMTILNNNGSTVLRRIARTVDDKITEPHIRRYYYWLLANEGNEDAKGDFQIDARGSTYLVDREIQAQNINMLFPQLMQHPDIHPGRLAEEVLQANRMNIKRLFLTDAEKAERAKQPPPVAPAVEAAKIRAASAEKIAEGRLEIDAGKLQSDFERGLADLELRGNISADNIRAMLAAKVMDLTGKTSMNDGPPAETPGRAPDGEAFSR